MGFLAPVLPYVAPYAAPAGYGALAGFGLAVTDHFKAKANGAPQSNFIASLANNLVIGATATVAGVGLGKLVSWAWSYIPAGTGDFIKEGAITAAGSAKAYFLALPLAAQIAIPVVIGALVIGAIGIAILKSRANNQQTQPPAPPAPPAP